MSGISEFINSYFLWKEAVAAGAVIGALCGFLGVYVVFRRIIFVSAALTQVSGLGVAISFYIQAVAVGWAVSFANPSISSLILTLAAAYLFALKKDSLKITQEGIIGFGFLLASASVLILGDKITRGAHDISDIIFGTAVVVSEKELYYILTVALVVGLLHWKHYKDCIFVSFDPDSANLFNYPVKLTNALLLISIGAVISISTKAIGALPVFGLLTLPALCSLQLTEKLNRVFILSVIIGTVSSVLGYFFSFIFSIPTGASITLIASVIFIISSIINVYRTMH
jgi:zinc transport system permease protein